MSYLALYRRYRPVVFEDVVGQEHIVTILKNQVKSHRLSHAYLFCGTRGTGKTTVAKIFSRAINCLSPQNGDPCNQCTICLANQNIHVDIIEIDAASNNGVDEIRDLRDKVRFAPIESAYKVYIIDEVHMLSTGAFNALLKTLEEPPEHAVFILATTEPQKIPATILSRCQRYEFHRISINHIMIRLQEVLNDLHITIEERGLRAIAYAAQGGMRDALSLADQCIAYCNGNITTISYEQVLDVLGSMNQKFMFDIADAILSANITKAFILLHQLIEEGRDVHVFCQDLILHFRSLMLLSSSQSGRGNAFETNDFISGLFYDAQDQSLFMQQKERCTALQAIRIIELLSGATAAMRAMTYPRIALETAIIKACSMIKSKATTVNVNEEIPDDLSQVLLARISNLESEMDLLKKSTASVSAPPKKTQKIKPAGSEAPPEVAPLPVQHDVDSTDEQTIQNIAPPTPGLAKEIFEYLLENLKEAIRTMLVVFKWTYSISQKNNRIYFNLIAPQAVADSMFNPLKANASEYTKIVQKKYPDIEVCVLAGHDVPASSGLRQKAAALFGANNIVDE